MVGKFYSKLIAVTALLILLVACVTTEPTVDSSLSESDQNRVKRVDSVQQVKILKPTEKQLLTVPDTTKHPATRRNG